jgi:putative tryptophan/tyrosine transport system substrate-binding protein
MTNIFHSILVAVALLASAVIAEAQQGRKIPLIGYLTGDRLSGISPVQDAFRQGLRDLGYIEGKTIFIEWRSHEGNSDRQPALAAELVRLKPDVIVAVGVGDIRAVKEATTSIPIVMVQAGDAVGSGFVTSLARPGGNITGLSNFRPELSGKRLEILKETLPKASRVAAFTGSTQGLGTGDAREIRNELDRAAGALGLKIQYFEIQKSNDIEIAFRQAKKTRAEGVIFIAPGPLVSPQRPQIAAFAVESQLPVIYERPSEVEAGGLMCYGVNTPELYRRAATYVDKILKGAKPADLPIEQPIKFEFVVNLKAAQQIGLTIPPNVLVRATRVIK